MCEGANVLEELIGESRGEEGIRKSGVWVGSV